MAAANIPLSHTPEAEALRQAIRGLQTSIATLVNIKDAMAHMVDTTPDPDSFAVLEGYYVTLTGAGHGAALKAELESMLSKLTTNASVSAVLDARNQLAAKCGVV